MEILSFLVYIGTLFYCFPQEIYIGIHFSIHDSWGVWARPRVCQRSWRVFNFSFGFAPFFYLSYLFIDWFFPPRLFVAFFIFHSWILGKPMSLETLSLRAYLLAVLRKTCKSNFCLYQRVKEAQVPSFLMCIQNKTGQQAICVWCSSILWGFLSPFETLLVNNKGLVTSVRVSGNNLHYSNLVSDVKLHQTFLSIKGACGVCGFSDTRVYQSSGCRRRQGADDLPLSRD